MFWQKYVELCEQNNIKPRMLAKELGVSPATVTRWKNGSVPGKETLETISKKFNVTVDYLINDAEISIDINSKKSTLKTLAALPQRWASLRHGPDINNDIPEIIKFVRCNQFFLTNLNYKEFEGPLSDRSDNNVLNLSTLDLILGIMDRCPDTDELRIIQIQLSHIVRYWLGEFKTIDYPEGINYKSLHSPVFPGVSNDKLDFLYDKETILNKYDSTFKYGFNFTELDAIREVSGVSFLYMFTGIKYSELSKYVIEDDTL